MSQELVIDLAVISIRNKTGKQLDHIDPTEVHSKVIISPSSYPKLDSCLRSKQLQIVLLPKEMLTVSHLITVLEHSTC